MISFSNSVLPQTMPIAQQPLGDVNQAQLPSLMTACHIEPIATGNGKQIGKMKANFKHRKVQQQTLKQAKVDKSVFCETCNITLNSATIYETHCQGAKHLKRLAQINAILPQPVQVKLCYCCCFYYRFIIVSDFTIYNPNIHNIYEFTAYFQSYPTLRLLINIYFL